MNEKEKGTEIEHEHDDTIKKIAADAKAGKLKPLSFYTKMISEDHLEEISDYYTRLMKMEKEAEKGKGKKSDNKGPEGLDDKEMDKAFGKWTDLGEKWGEASPISEDNEPHYPDICIKSPSGEFKVGDEMEVKFKCTVSSVSKDKDGMRVRLELKEAQF